VFGTILTKLRTRLGNKALVTIAELKLYLREEHLRAHAVKKRLKRSFGTAFGDESVDRSVPLATPAHAAEASLPQSASENSEGTAPYTEPSIRGIVTALVEAVELDDTPPPAPAARATSIPIKNLFDFTQPYWVEAYEKLGMRGLQEELELCELLDLDAEGDTVEDEADDALNE
jgi:hypothetical protein